MTPVGRGGEKRREASGRGWQTLTRQAKSPRSSKCRGYSTHVSSLPPTTALALSPSPSRRLPGLSTPSSTEERREAKADGRTKEGFLARVHLASFPLILSLSLSLYVSRCPLSSFSSFSDTSFSLLSVSTFFSCISDMKTVGRRISKRPAAS